MSRLIRSALSCALVLVAFTALTATASATTYCVGAGSVCDESFAFTSAGFADALTAYTASSSNDDTIQVAAGTITFTNTIDIEDGIQGDLSIVGAGSGKTKFVFDSVDGMNLHADFAGDSSISGLKVEVIGTALPDRVGLALHGGAADDVYVLMAAGNNRAFTFANTTECRNCRAAVSGTSIAFHIDEGSATIVDSKAEVYDPDSGVPTRGVSLQAPLSEVTLSRTILKGFNRGLFVPNGLLSAKDTLIDLGDQDGALGLEMDAEGTFDLTANASLDGVTIVGTGANQRGVTTTENATGTGVVVTTLSNTLSWLTGTDSADLHCKTQGTVPLMLGIYSSMVQVFTADSNCGMTTHSLATGTPTFVDAAAGDYRPAPGSPVIDAGNPASADVGRFDLWGATRYVNGADFNFAGDIDIGAGEYQNYSPNKPEASATPTTVVAGAPVTFSATGDDPNEQQVTFTWDFGDGTDGAGASTAHSYAVPGVYKAKAIASDGSLTRASAAIEITVLPAPLLPSILLGKPTAKFKYAKKKAKPFALGTASSKPRIPLTTNFAGEVTLTLARIKGGWTSGKKCVLTKPKKGKSKRCNLPLRGSQKLTVPAGLSFLTFGGKWGRSALPTGSYLLTVSGGGTRHETAMNSIRNIK